MSIASKVAATLFVLAAIGAAVAQQDKEAKAKPGREHEIIKQLEGDWDVRSKHMMPGKAADESRGTETAQMTLGGFWLVFDHKANYHGEPFEGHGLMGYDPAKAKYVGTWVDSISPHLLWFDGEADASGKCLTMKTHGVNPKTGKPCEGRMVFQVTDRDHRTICFYQLDDTGKEVLRSEMTYTRKSAEIK